MEVVQLYVSSAYHHARIQHAFNACFTALATETRVHPDHETNSFSCGQLMAPTCVVAKAAMACIAQMQDIELKHYFTQMFQILADCALIW